MGSATEDSRLKKGEKGIALLSTSMWKKYV